MKHLDLVGNYLDAIGIRSADVGPVTAIDTHTFATEVEHKSGMPADAIHLVLSGIGEFTPSAKSHFEEVFGLNEADDSSGAESDDGLVAVAMATLDEATRAEYDAKHTDTQSGFGVIETGDTPVVLATQPAAQDSDATADDISDESDDSYESDDIEGT